MRETPIRATLIAGVLAAGLCLLPGCNPQGQSAQSTPTPVSSPVRVSVADQPNSVGLTPLPGKSAPEITEKKVVKMTTDAGDLTIEVYPQAAPNAAKRFIELVEAGFYDNTPIFRVVRSPQPFVAQFGINWREKFPEWQDKNFDDDPSFFKLDRGTLAFAKAGPNTNSTQVFIN
ncbi:MAG: peptidylprolyl isomerase, partial [Candidatus Eremiobacteraeota bacterium]|nr:peptidylprolyl isomerase [Candidatus Eremiobacteraeota bacterium]